MSASMTEVLGEHRYMYGKTFSEGRVEVCSCGWETTPDTDQKSWEGFAAHQAEALAANGYGKLEDAWDEGYTTGNAHSGRRDANPYRRPE